MLTFKNSCAQGDIYIRRVDALPKNATLVTPENGYNVVAHSETGHNHVMVADRVKMYKLPDSIMDIFVEVNEAADLEHLRSFDTHEPIRFEKGVYHIRRQREHVPEGFRRVED